MGRMVVWVEAAVVEDTKRELRPDASLALDIRALALQRKPLGRAGHEQTVCGVVTDDKPIESKGRKEP